MLTFLVCILLIKQLSTDKGKPQVIVGRKATGLKSLIKIAGLPY